MDAKEFRVLFDGKKCYSKSLSSEKMVDKWSADLNATVQTPMTPKAPINPKKVGDVFFKQTFQQRFFHIY